MIISAAKARWALVTGAGSLAGVTTDNGIQYLVITRHDEQRTDHVEADSVEDLWSEVDGWYERQLLDSNGPY